MFGIPGGRGIAGDAEVGDPSQDLDAFAFLVDFDEAAAAATDIAM
jgi:hypothetical protein